MAIDGIGGGKPPFGANGAKPASPVAAGKSFEIKGEAQSTDSAARSDAPKHDAVKHDAVRRSEAPPEIGTSDVERLQRGEITREQYLQARVEQAVQHLQGALPPERLSEIKEQLMDQLQGADPVLEALLERATSASATGQE